MSGAPLGATISTVENLIKTQMQLDNISDRRFNGSWDCAKTLVQERGIRIIYTGHAINTVREAAFLGTYFYTYEGLRVVLERLNRRDSLDIQTTSTWSIPIAGGVSGALSWFMTFPLDCIRAGIQGQRLTKPEQFINSCDQIICAGLTSKKISSIDVFKDIIKSKGLFGLYSGVAPTLARAFIVSATRFSAYEFALRMFG